jgi:hypothetical protein
VLPPTTEALHDPEHRPYFLWWLDATVADLRRHLAATDQVERAYWMGALLREANTRDVWLFVEEKDIVELWPQLTRYLGKTRERWAWLLGLPLLPWPPPEAYARGV